MKTFMEYLTEEGTLYSKHSGLEGVVIYASTVQNVNGRHGPRIKVSNIINQYKEDDNYSISLVPPFDIVAGESRLPKDKQVLIEEWIIKNLKVLMKFWNNGYPDTNAFKADIKKVSKNNPDVLADE